MVANFPSVYLLQMQQRFLGIVHPRIVTTVVEDRALVAVAAVLAMVMEWRPCPLQIDCCWNVHQQLLTVRAVAEDIAQTDFAFVIILFALPKRVFTVWLQSQRAHALHEAIK